MYEVSIPQTDTERFQAVARMMVELIDEGVRFGSDGNFNPNQGNGPEPAELKPDNEPPGEGEVSLPLPPSVRRHLGEFALQAA
jgi:hypothetical protein